MITRLRLQQAVQQLEQAGVDAPRKDAELMLMYAWNISATALIINMLEQVPSDVAQAFDRLLLRRLKREPLAYILGVKPFWKHTFVVSEHVLIPRPETEHLLERVLQYCAEQGAALSVADIGTGSGCIAVSLAKEYSESHVTACDISAKALDIAKINATNIGVVARMSFYQGNLYQALPEGEKFDVIVSNPPYVSQIEMLDLAQELTFEPRFALTDENSGLTLLKRLINQAHVYLKPQGLLILESGLCGMPQASAYLDKLQDYYDLAGNFRGTVFRMRPTS